MKWHPDKQGAQTERRELSQLVNKGLGNENCKIPQIYRDTGEFRGPCAPREASLSMWLNRLLESSFHFIQEERYKLSELLG